MQKRAWNDGDNDEMDCASVRVLTEPLEWVFCLDNTDKRPADDQALVAAKRSAVTRSDREEEFTVEDARNAITRALQEQEARLRAEYDNTLQRLRNEQYHSFATHEKQLNDNEMNYLS